MNDLKAGLLLGGDYICACSKRQTVELDILAVKEFFSSKKIVGCCCVYSGTSL